MKKAYHVYQNMLEDIKSRGLWKAERIINSAQGTMIQTSEHGHILNMCANNYLGFSSDQRVMNAAKGSFDQWGFGLSSVRFICGTQSLHKQLEWAVSDFLGTEDTLLYSSCFDANTGLFETLLTDADAVLSDELNHASIIDGIRLCKAKRYRYQNNDMDDLERQLKAARQDGARLLLIATDGVFSMDGTQANLPKICDLAEAYDALVMVDDSHGVGVVGPNGRGTPAFYGLSERIDILTGNFGKALGGGSGGYTSSRRVVIDLLRQRSRPYLFSNALAPVMTAAALEVIQLLKSDSMLINKLEENTAFFRKLMRDSGFEVIPGTHPIVPVMIYDEEKTLSIAEALLNKGVFVIGFTYPVVPLGRARIRVQVSAAHTPEQLTFAAECFKQASDDYSK